MGKKRETIDTGPFLTELQTFGYFRKISDRVQVGLPDIQGCYRSKFIAFEVKSVDEVPLDRMVPELGSHCFSGKQRHDLNMIAKQGGLAFAVVICGIQASINPAANITEKGQVPWSLEPKWCQLTKAGSLWGLQKFLDTYISIRGLYG